MNKKEIYEHLANIYLDASSKSSKKRRTFSAYPKTAQVILIVGLVATLGLGSAITYSHIQNHNPPGQIALFLYKDTAKINFNFEPASREVFSLNLNQLNLSRYNALGFSVRKTNSHDIISLRIEFTNRFNEKSEVYIKDILNKWTDHRIELNRFLQIKDWKQMKELAFSVEEWNAREKTGIVYLDNIRVIK